MAKTRERVCSFYICEGNCSKGREGTFNHKCQTCDKYLPKPGSRPRRKDLRREKKEKYMKDRRYWD